MRLEDLAGWHSAEACEATGAAREFHRSAAQLLRDLIKRETARSDVVKAGVAPAHAEGRVGGRAKIDLAIEAWIRKMLKDGATARQIIAEVGCGAAVIYRIKTEVTVE